MPQGASSALAIVTAAKGVNIPARQPALYMMQASEITQIDRSMVWNG